MPDIIVTANHGSVDSSNFQNSSPSFGQQNMAAARASQYWDAKPAPLTKDSDVPDNEDIVVIGKRLKEEAKPAFVNSSAVPGGIVRNIRCVGTVKFSELSNILNKINFNATNTDYGPGRAGANKVGSGSGAVPVDINVEQLRAYAALDGGLTYLLWHEVAHALKYMQEYNAAQFANYRQTTGAGLTADQAKAAYPGSTQFKQNEARANTIAFDLAKNGNKSWNFTPTNDYDLTCS